MSDEQEKYSKILQMVLQASGTPINDGETIIFNWRDEYHLDEWINMSSEPSENSCDGIRVLRIDTVKFPFFQIDQNPNDVTIVAMAFGNAPDFSDLKSCYYMVIKGGTKGK